MGKGLVELGARLRGIGAVARGGDRGGSTPSLVVTRAGAELSGCAGRVVMAGLERPAGKGLV